MGQRQLVIEAARKFQETGGDKAGRLAEEKISLFIEKHQKDFSIPLVSFDGIRIPRVDQKGKYEIDSLCISPKGVLLIEVKNYGGFIKEDEKNGDWVQKNSSQKVLYHKNPLFLLEQKKIALQKYLASLGFSYGLEHFESVLLNVNENMILDARLAKNPRIKRLEDLGFFLDALKPNRKFLFWWEKETLKEYKKACHLLKDLPTWDEITLYGGSIIKGDIQKMAAHFNLRPTVQRLEFFMPRSRLLGWFMPPFSRLRKREGLFKWRLKRVKEPLDVIKIQPAGKKEVMEIKVCHVTRVEFGWRYQSS